VAKGILVALALMVTAASTPHAQQPAPESQKLRKQILLMEGLLARAGAVAAQTIGSQLQELEPGLTVLIGQPRARGFIMDGYGIFFHVEVPALNGTIVWSQMLQQREMQIGNALSNLKRALEDMPDGPSRQQAQQAVSILNRQAGPVQARLTASGAAVKAQTVETAVLTMRDPNEAYKQEVKLELIDAILHHSLQLNVAPESWLHVGAHMAETPQGQRGATLMIRVKGSDLAIFAADPARRDEIRGKIEVREY